MEQNIQMYANASTTTDSMVSIDVPEDGKIVGVHLNLRAPNMEAGKYAQVELSFLSTSQTSSNDARGVIARTVIATSLLNTNGLASGHGNEAYSFKSGLPVNAGERLHLHYGTNTTSTVHSHVVITFEFKGPLRSGRRRG